MIEQTELRGLTDEQLAQRIQESEAELQELRDADDATPAGLSDRDDRRFHSLMADHEQLTRRRDSLELVRASASNPRARLAGADPGQRREPLNVDTGAGAVTRSNPLAYTAAALDELQDAIEARTASRVDAGLEERAALTTGTYGAPRVWGSNVLAGPRLLHVAAGVPTQPADAIFAQFPQLTLPAASPAVGEGVTLVEYASSAAGSVTLGRFGRWTDLSEESQIGADAGAIVGMHTIAASKDLDKVLIDATGTAAGAAVPFNADVPAAVRTAIARVVDSTAQADVSGVVILVNPDNAALLQDVTPIGGETIAEEFQRFSGALVYPSSAVDTGFMTVANLRAGVRYFEAMALRTVTDTAVKTGVTTVATAVISGYALGLSGGFAVKVDVVTP